MHSSIISIMRSSPTTLFLLSLFILSLSSAVRSTTFTVTNNCRYNVWVGILSNSDSPLLATTGFALGPDESHSVDAPVPWSGRFWGRTICSVDPTSGRFSCASGDCGSGTIQCDGRGAAPPATLAEFTLGGGAGAGTDFYDVSLVDGYNLPILVAPQGGGGGSCVATGCLVDLNRMCPQELRVPDPAGDGQAVACMSACEAFRTPRYCCDGEFGSPAACGPTAYSQLFKTACPRAYSYAYDDATSTFTCATADTTGYTITFCPSTTSLKSYDGGRTLPTALPLMNVTLMLGSTASTSSPLQHLRIAFLLLLVTFSWIHHPHS